MKKLLTGFLGASLCLSLFACGKKSEATTKKTTKSPTTTTQREKTTTHNDKTKDLLARIDIVSENGSNRFVTEPTRTNKWDYTNCNVSVTNGEDVEIDAAVAGVKVRGNYTTDYEKKPLRIKFEEKQNVLGLNNGKKFKNWLLLACYKDWSMLRDATAFEITRNIHSCLCRLWWYRS